jgi:uncharacterized protein HemX
MPTPPNPQTVSTVSEILSSSGGGNIWALLITAVSAVTGKYAWDFYKKKASLNHKERGDIRKDVKDEKLLDRKDRNAHRDDLKDRVEKLEEKLDKAIKDKETLMVQVGELKAQVAVLTMKIEMLLGASGIKVETPAPAPVKQPDPPAKAEAPKRGRKKNV